MDSDPLYSEMVDFVIASGRRIVKRAGKIEDIGVKKRFLTEEDVAIERGMKALIEKRHPEHAFYSEEENDTFRCSDDVWIADPLSGTRTFLQGLPHYAIVAAHVCRGVVQFGVVYDPSVNELFTALRGKGSFLNGNKISVSDCARRVVFNLSYFWADERAKQYAEALKAFETERNSNSHAVNLCHVACGRFDGVVSLCKDSFPMFAGSLIVTEAGGVFTNREGSPRLSHTDRIFFGGNKKIYGEIRRILP